MFTGNQILKVNFDPLPDFKLSWNFNYTIILADNAIIYNLYYYKSKMAVVTKWRQMKVLKVISIVYYITSNKSFFLF